MSKNIRLSESQNIIFPAGVVKIKTYNIFSPQTLYNISLLQYLEILDCINIGLLPLSIRKLKFTEYSEYNNNLSDLFNLQDLNYPKYIKNFPPNVQILSTNDHRNVERAENLKILTYNNGFNAFFPEYIEKLKINVPYFIRPLTHLRILICDGNYVHNFPPNIEEFYFNYHMKWEGINNLLKLRQLRFIGYEHRFGAPMLLSELPEKLQLIFFYFPISEKKIK
jgi:hypothetical protein